MYCTGVRTIGIGWSQLGLAYTEEELAEQRQKQEQQAKTKLVRQRELEKARRERRKARLLAENGSELVRKRICGDVDGLLLLWPFRLLSVCLFRIAIAIIPSYLSLIVYRLAEQRQKGVQPMSGHTPFDPMPFSLCASLSVQFSDFFQRQLADFRDFLISEDAKS